MAPVERAMMNDVFQSRFRELMLFLYYLSASVPRPVSEVVISV